MTDITEPISPATRVLLMSVRQACLMVATAIETFLRIKPSKARES